MDPSFSSFSMLLEEMEHNVRKNQQAMEDTLLQVARMKALLSHIPSESERYWLKGLLEAHRNQRAEFFPAMPEGQANVAIVHSDAIALDYEAADDGFRVGRRKLPLTKREHEVLSLLWRDMPEPVARETVRNTLYTDKKKPALATVDVFVSHLRSKIKVLTGDVDVIRSVRGRGWALRSELCQAKPHKGGGEYSAN